MPLVIATDLLEHARESGFRVIAVELVNLKDIVAVVEAAEQAAAPLILTLAMDRPRVLDAALAAAVAVARAATVPMVVEARLPPGGEAVARAIRHGANSLLLVVGDRPEPKDIESAVGVSQACGVPWFIGPGAVADRHACRLSGDDDAVRAMIGHAIADSGTAGRAERALTACRRWREVEHLILFNVDAERDENHVERMMTRGRAALGAIPGVRRVLTGRALQDHARYRYCWLVRFASPAVVASYRNHPDHVRFADTEFRPVAADRLSIDYQLWSDPE